MAEWKTRNLWKPGIHSTILSAHQKAVVRPCFSLSKVISQHCRVRISSYEHVMGQYFKYAFEKCFCTLKNWSWRQWQIHHLPWEHQFCILQNAGSNGGRGSTCKWASGPLTHSEVFRFTSHPQRPTNTILTARGCCSLSNTSARVQPFNCFFFIWNLQLKYLSKNFAQGTRITKERWGWKVVSECITKLLESHVNRFGLFPRAMPNHWKILSVKEAN